MVSNISQIVYQLFQKETLDEVSESELRYFIRQYPYVGMGHLLLAKKLQLAGEKRAFEREISVTSVYFNNPAWLQFVLRQDKLALSDVFAEDPENILQDISGLLSEEVIQQIPETEIKETPDLLLRGQSETASHDITEVQGQDIYDDIARDVNEVAEEDIPEHTQEENYTKEEKTTFEEEEEPALADEGKSAPELEEKTVFAEDAKPEISVEEKPALVELERPESEEEQQEPEETLQPVGIERTEPAIEEIPTAHLSDIERKSEIEHTTEPSGEPDTEKIQAHSEDKAHSEDIETDEKPVIIPSPEISPGEIKTDGKEIGTNEPQTDNKLEFDPYYTIDYFASQGIKLKMEDYSRDKLGQQLKSFTEWIRSMKRLPQEVAENNMDATDQHSIRRIAEHSVEEKEVLTESMAEVWVKQGNYEKARQVYRKLSLQNPSKSTYFAAKIEQIKVL
ncbi:MAG TPA: hypothetical protein VK616_00205 [Flavitalea sp.]|nr:hypothetical protein [Flavitalea sp.]